MSNIEKRVKSIKKKKSADIETLGKFTVTKAFVHKYSKQLVWLVAQVNELIKMRIIPVLKNPEKRLTFNADDNTIDSVSIDSLSRAFFDIEKETERLRQFSVDYVLHFIKMSNERNRDLFRDAFKREFAEKYALSFEKVTESDSIRQALKLSTENNLNLVKSLSTDYLTQVKTTILTKLQSGNFESADIEKMIIEKFNISRRRAKLIASDQSHKINSSLTRIRSEDMGIKKYVWRNSNDMRVRGRPDGFYPDAKYNHWTREGKIYYFDSPPADGNPGMPINCRCYAEPVVFEK